MKSSGKIVYSSRLDGSLAAEEGKKWLDEDLKTLSLQDFCRKHEIEEIPE